MTQTRNILLTLTAALLLSVVAPPAVHAQAVTKITDTQIRAFYAELKTLFKRPYNEFLTRYESRVHDDLQYNSDTEILIKGQPPMQADSLTMTKSDLVSNADRAYENGKTANLQSDIETITIAPDGKSARVKVISSAKGLLFPAADGSQMKADTTESCEEDLVLNPQGKLQILTSNCHTQINILN